MEQEASDDVPRYFLCPISLQIMKDPVTAPTGISYDRSSIERWLFSDTISTNDSDFATCPATNLPLPRDPDHLTPNHTLRRLIQSWCAAGGLDRIPSPRPPVDSAAVAALLRDLSVSGERISALRRISTLITDSEKNRRLMVQSNAAEEIIKVITTISASSSSSSSSKELLVLEESVNVLHALRLAAGDLVPIAGENHDIVDAITYVLKESKNTDVRCNAVLLIGSVLEVGTKKLFERLKIDFFESIISLLNQRIPSQVRKSILKLLLNSCPWGRNRSKIVEAGAVSELIELELNITPSMADKRTTELIFSVLDRLCTCADGRAQLVGHPAGIALISKRILRVSATVDERGVRIISSICKFSGTKEVLTEMLRVRAVSKLLLVLQSDCSRSVKEKARSALKFHSHIWKNSPCINVYLLSRYP